MKTNKTLYRILILAGFILINAGILYGISQVIAFLNTGADRSKMLHLDETKERHYVPQVTWESIENPGRPMEEANLTSIEEDYLDAWYVKNRAFYTGENAGVFDHFTEQARGKVEDLITLNNEENVYIESTTLTHHLTLEFYSADGTLVVLTDRNVTGVERVFKNEQFLVERSFNDDYKIILLLEDGFWRVRHFEKIASHPVDDAQKETIPLDLAMLEGINYYPQGSPWDTFGAMFSKDTLITDFKIVNNLKLNSIRVFVGFEDFGKARVPREKLEKLTSLLDEAQAANLKVVVTLFDFYGDYRIQDWTITNAHLYSIVTHLKDHPALLGWDIKNEPNLDFESRGQREVLSWLSQTIDYLKTIDNTHPVTIGWSSPEAALHLEDKVDLVSYHYYKDLKNLGAAHKSITDITSKPVVLQEFGLAAYNGLWNPIGPDEEDQAAYYTEFYKTQKRDSIHYLSWTLYDFRDIPSEVAGRLPWRKNKQAFFGIVNTLGVKDDAYLVIKNR
ncbi:glycoside hydrolase family 2 TIM barrel-domain containing protein [Dokdonia donghaensis]|uniref:Glycosyl hydrolase family 5 n=1 Tax=Dokdonia donghaensis DSW-1 TaxID=1300343 RepID=A0A0A2GRQ3_9FLAO|nr:glycoside hydrolase family 2 TIM barrel-domain containing protein [Dokdonia donghaensis]ANH60765.1 Sugar-binding cellulase-like protein [Dokdonia donghaensis DSW-1]KGO05969.1 glycosyl hydrolase family 5 [Dokdonia donghaensis DSW-1]